MTKCGVWRGRQRNAESYENAKHWAEGRWSEYDTEFEVVRGKDWSGRDEVQVHAVSTPVENREHNALYTVRIRDNQRYDDVIDTVEWEQFRGSIPSTPRAARAIAQAFMLAADIIAEKNFERRMLRQQQILEKVVKS